MTIFWKAMIIISFWLRIINFNYFNLDKNADSEFATELIIYILISLINNNNILKLESSNDDIISFKNYLLI